MAKFIFRKIGGRVIRIAIKGEKAGGDAFSTIRRITAVTSEGKRAGTMYLDVPKKGISAFVQNVDVGREYRRHGISKQMFNYSQKLLGRARKKFIRSNELLHEAQLSIRRSQGAKTKVIAHGVGQYGEQSKIVKPLQARRQIKALRTGIWTPTSPSHHSATTMINKKFRLKGRRKK